MVPTLSAMAPPPGPRRVLFFTTSLGGGGAESHLLRVINRLDRARFEPRLALTKRGGNYEQFLVPDVAIDTVGVAQVPSSTARLLTAAPLLRRAVARWQPDILCAVMDLPNMVALAAVAGMRSRPKVMACVQVSPISEHPRTRRGRAVLAGMKRFYPAADRIIALSHGVGAEVATLIPSVADRVRVIHNACVDERVLAARADGPGVPLTRRAVVLGVGRLTEQKGFHHLIDAFARLGTKHDAELWLLGEGPLRAQLEEQARRSGVNDRVRFLGFHVNPQDFMRRATVFVLSSGWEGFGNVVVEALACGTPVVSTLCPHGPADVLTDGVNGLCVAVGDRAGMAAAIDRALGDPELRQRLGAAGRERSRDFSAEAIAARYAEMMDELLGDGRAAGAVSARAVSAPA